MSNLLLGTPNETQRARDEICRSQLEQERSSFLPHWRDLGDYILPRRPRFELSDVNKGDRRNQKIIDSTATLAVRTLRSGMMAGITSPARPWFKLGTYDPGLAEYGPVKVWLNTVTERMTNVFLRSNLYNVLPLLYGDMGVFATGCILIEEDFDDVVRYYSIPTGSYMIANDDTGRVRVFFREFRLTVRQVVLKFGKLDWRTGKADWSNISDYVRQCWERGDYEVWVDVCHIIQLNDRHDDRLFGSQFKRYRACYYERGNTSAAKANYLGDKDRERYLREKGYDYFPVLAGRWEVTGEDAWGTDCPGMTSLGDVKALQTMHKRKAQGIDKKVNPAMVGPTTLRNQKASLLPGDITYLDIREGQQGFKPVHEVDIDLSHLLLDIQDHQQRIKRAYYEDLFLMLAESDRRQITAREIDERHEEKLLALGPVLEQLNQDILDPNIDITFEFMLRQSLDASNQYIDGGMIPRPPKELMGSNSGQLKVEYVSVMAQAQKLVGIASIERFSEFMSNRVKLTGDMSILDKVDQDQLTDVYADRLGIDPTIIISDDVVAATREKRAKAQAQAQAAETINSASGAAKNLADASLDGDNALTRVIDQAQAGQLTPTQP